MENTLTKVYNTGPVIFTGILLGKYLLELQAFYRVSCETQKILVIIVEKTFTV